MKVKSKDNPIMYVCHIISTYQLLSQKVTLLSYFVTKSPELEVHLTKIKTLYLFLLIKVL
jgi:hypothetical protein